MLVFRLLKLRLHETGSVTPQARVNASRPRILRTPVKEDVIIVGVGREQWRCSHDVA